MRNISIVLLASTLFCAAPAIAGTGHEHGPGGSHSHGPISGDAAIAKAQKHVKTLVARNKLDKSWADAKATGATQKDFGKGAEWVVTVKNEKAGDAAKQTLYVFYTVDGTYIASNFDGK